LFEGNSISIVLQQQSHRYNFLKRFHFILVSSSSHHQNFQQLLKRGKFGSHVTSRNKQKRTSNHFIETVRIFLKTTALTVNKD